MRLKATFYVVIGLFATVAFGVTLVVAAPNDDLRVKVLSNRADLISGGNALVEVVLPAEVNPDAVRVTVDGLDVTNAFAVRADGRFYGLINGLKVGDNEVMARVLPTPTSPPGRTPALITINNHPLGGPVFSGAQLQPWICARRVATPVTVTVPGTSLSSTVTTKVSGLDEDPFDDQCNAPTKYTFYYQPKSKEGSTCTFTITGSNPCFQLYDLNNPPARADIADFTNDRGHTVKSIVRLERGTMNRGIYQLVTFYDPTEINAPWSPPKGWNGKLLWNFGAASGVSRFQEPPATSVWTDAALRRGFMVASASLTDHDKNANDTLAAEAVMMLKEHITETYGEIRYTIGSGGSGGAILQQNIAAAYPGLVNGIRPSLSFPDTITTAIEVADCGYLQNEYYRRLTTSELNSEQRAAINGHLTTGVCAGWITSFLPTGNPSRATTCGSGFPSALVYDPILRPDGVRCIVPDHDVGMLGTFVDTDGNTKAQAPYDNVGVQYGLKTLQNGVISEEQFVALNYGVGGYTADQVWTGPANPPHNPAPRREVPSLSVLDTVYRAGIVTCGRQLAKTAIIDLRHNATTADFHANWRAWSVRERIQKAYGDHGNHLIWAYTSSAYLPDSLLTMDEWLSNIERDTSDLQIEEKVRANKPAHATDLCMIAPNTNVGLGTNECPVKYEGSPRQVAGGPLAENVMKCQLKPLAFIDPDYDGIVFTTDQKARLAAVFPDGVCDWSKPGVGQVAADGWTTFAAGPGGRPLGNPPGSTLLCPYPELAGYTGEGSPDLAANYMCVPAVEVRIEPETLNLKSKGTFTAFITVPEGYDVREWGISNLVCEGALAEKGMVSGDGRTYIAKFNRQDLINVAKGEGVTFTVQGTFQKNGKQTQFRGSDTVRVIK